MSASSKACKYAAAILALSCLGGCAYQQPLQEPSCAGSIPLVSGYATPVQPVQAVAVPVKKRVYKAKKRRAVAVAKPVRKTARRTVARRAAPKPAVAPPIPLPLEPVQPTAMDQTPYHIPDRLQ